MTSDRSIAIHLNVIAKSSLPRSTFSFPFSFIFFQTPIFVHFYSYFKTLLCFTTCSPPISTRQFHHISVKFSSFEPLHWFCAVVNHREVSKQRVLAKTTDLTLAQRALSFGDSNHRQAIIPMIDRTAGDPHELDKVQSIFRRTLGLEKKTINIILGDFACFSSIEEILPLYRTLE